jgi:hypothetical protein
VVAAVAEFDGSAIHLAHFTEEQHNAPAQTHFLRWETTDLKSTSTKLLSSAKGCYFKQSLRTGEESPNLPDMVFASSVPNVDSEVNPSRTTGSRQVGRMFKTC